MHSETSYVDVGPHRFKPLGWILRRGDCLVCFKPRSAHPTRGYTRARPMPRTSLWSWGALVALVAFVCVMLALIFVSEPARSKPVNPTYQGLTARQWASKAVRARTDANTRARTIRRLRASVRRRWQDTSLEAIAYASTAYGVSYTTLRRKAHCETGGTFDPYAKNPGSTASGLFQFLTSTWASTPYARYSIWDPYANALAAAWMHRVGRGGEWVCQ